MRRALAALALLPLIGATQDSGELTEAATCTWTHARTEAAFRALPKGWAETDARGAVYSFEGGIIWGAPAEPVIFSDYRATGADSASQTFEAVAWGDYTNARIVLLGGVERELCDRERERHCEVDLGIEDGWRKSLTFTQPGANRRITLTCKFTKVG